jgi:hypothetical protein
VKDDQRGGSQTGLFARTWRSYVEFSRSGRPDDEWQQRLDEARQIEDPQVLVPLLEISIACSEAAGDGPTTDALIGEWAASGRANPGFLGGSLPAVARTMIARGKIEELKDLIAVAIVPDSPFPKAQKSRVDGLVLEAEGRHLEAIEAIKPVWEVGEPLGHAVWPVMAKIDAARNAIAAGLDSQAAEWIEEAKSGARRLESPRLLAEIEGLQEATAAAAG